ncbi:MAG: 5,10-methenyltetrahydrofolate synthetase [Nitrosopumilus sp.]|nr:5,10-methenyltetrahydrofolate synthetase [Nitrosopumilus sp.]
MTIRYEANPPKILPDKNLEELISNFVNKIKLISNNCDSIHLTENVLGHARVSPIKVGKIIKKEIPNLPITVSLRVRDKSKIEIEEFVREAISVGFSGILVLLGDPSQNGQSDSGLIPSQVVKMLKEKRIDSKIELYLSISNKPNFSKIEKKLEANPKGFITQVVDKVEQVQKLAENLKGYSLIPIVLYPSEKNEASAKFLGLDFGTYRENFNEFLNQIHQITGDVLITSPSDFLGLNQFLEKRST